MTGNRKLQRANRTLATKLFVIGLAMFGFGYALVPLYDVFCEITGLNGKTGRVDAAEVRPGEIDQERWVTVEFTGNAMAGLPWEFKPMAHSLRVHPGEPTTVNYYARNTSREVIVGQAVPSVTPNKAASKFNKIECFCFTQQTLKPGEAKEMPVHFVIEPDLAKEVNTVTLSYAFFNTDKVQAKRFGGDAAPADSHQHVHAHPATPGG